MRNLVFLASVALLVTGVFFTGLFVGMLACQNQAEDRSMLLPDPGYETDCYTWHDIEYVIHGNIQE